MFTRVCIVGPGLIGASFGLALREKKLAREVIGVARSHETRSGALQIGACTSVTSDVIEAATGADLVFLAPPVGQMRAICAQIALVVAPGALVTDAGSTKGQIVAQCEPLFLNARFIGGHPMAGSEKTGPLAARADLFHGAKWILTPTPRTEANALLDLAALIEELGATPIELEAQTHDELLAVTSHLPHLTATMLVHTLLGAKAKNPAAPQLVAGGWRDGTRVAAGSAEMWRDICLANKMAISGALSELSGQIADIQAMLESDNASALGAWLSDAAIERRRY